MYVSGKFIREYQWLVGAFTVTRPSTNTCNSVTIKTLVKIVKYLKFLAKL